MTGAERAVSSAALSAISSEVLGEEGRVPDPSWSADQQILYQQARRNGLGTMFIWPRDQEDVLGLLTLAVSPRDEDILNKHRKALAEILNEQGRAWYALADPLWAIVQRLLDGPRWAKVHKYDVKDYERSKGRVLTEGIPLLEWLAGEGRDTVPVEHVYPVLRALWQVELFDLERRTAGKRVVTKATTRRRDELRARGVVPRQWSGPRWVAPIRKSENPNLRLWKWARDLVASVEPDKETLFEYLRLIGLKKIGRRST